MRYSPPALINRCDLTERITHEPSLIRSLFLSGPGDRSSSHIPLTLETLLEPFPNPPLKAVSDLSVVFFVSLSLLKTNSWVLRTALRGSVGSVGFSRP